MHCCVKNKLLLVCSGFNDFWLSELFRRTLLRRSVEYEELKEILIPTSCWVVFSPFPILQVYHIQQQVEHSFWRSLAAAGKAAVFGGAGWQVRAQAHTFPELPIPETAGDAGLNCPLLSLLEAAHWKLGWVLGAVGT